jgi:hypothetical protein
MGCGDPAVIKVIDTIKVKIPKSNNQPPLRSGITRSSAMGSHHRQTATASMVKCNDWQFNAIEGSDISHNPRRISSVLFYLLNGEPTEVLETVRVTEPAAMPWLVTQAPTINCLSQKKRYEFKTQRPEASCTT